MFEDYDHAVHTPPAVLQSTMLTLHTFFPQLYMNGILYGNSQW